MSVETPQFSKPSFGRKGYAAAEVDAFVGRVVRQLNGQSSPDSVASADFGIMWFNEARGSSAYDAEEVDEWLTRMREVVERLEGARRESDLPAEREGSVLDMPAPPHFADRFPRVSRAVLGFAVSEVDEMLLRLHRELVAGTAPEGRRIASIRFSEEHGGYRQNAVRSVLELIAMARDLR